MSLCVSVCPHWSIPFKHVLPPLPKIQCWKFDFIFSGSYGKVVSYFFKNFSLKVVWNRRYFFFNRFSLTHSLILCETVYGTILMLMLMHKKGTFSKVLDNIFLVASKNNNWFEEKKLNDSFEDLIFRYVFFSLITASIINPFDQFNGITCLHLILFKFSKVFLPGHKIVSKPNRLIKGEPKDKIIFQKN